MVMLLVVAKPSRCFLYKGRPVNHAWKRSEPFAKHRAASSRNGVVGTSGMTTPIVPMATQMNPANIRRIFLSLSMMTSELESGDAQFANWVVDVYVR